MDAIFQDWVYRNLKDFGNCSVNPDVLKEHNRREIERDIKEHGFKRCSIKHYETKDFDRAFNDPVKVNNYLLEMCVISV